MLWKCVLDVAAGKTVFPSYKGGWLAEELSDAAKLTLLDDPAREVLTALGRLLETARVNEYGTIKDLLQAHPGHPQLGNDAHVRRVLERIRERLGLKSIAAARWYGRVVPGAGEMPPNRPSGASEVRPRA